ncbi:ATP-binding protein [Actinomadura sp. HBU206391]|uniref:ATP-binding protein n=1 Tax=Actinomadura sp. HBU206391 TaxID=2731692 RepID=UPI00164FD026|nr:ATP-binding protein [Actinomadura sp. HBU206391]MBC6461731.1 HAMP domain-containing histidine kinase [Actinomadura sp. HBU206391]
MSPHQPKWPPAVAPDRVGAHLTALGSQQGWIKPPGQDKDAHLARTIGTTLDRLEEAKGQLERVVDQQRRFVRDASHELRTPIAGLRLRIEEAQLHPAETDLDHLLEQALNDIDRLQEIITGLLMLARPDTGTGVPEARRTLDLAELVRAQLSARPDQHTMQPRLQPGVMVNAVPNQVINLLTHLLDNAQRHARETVRIRVSRSGDDAELTVTDDGDGITEADHERIFQPFTRLDHARSRDHGGAGLGLAIARHIATTHHGTLTIDNPPTGGARFTLRLPRRDAR